MTSFKLKSGLKLTPEDNKYLIVDEGTQCTYRVGHYEYLILKQLKEATNLEEVGYGLRTEFDIIISYDKLNRFIQKAVDLNIVEVINDSMWGRMKSTGPFAFRMKLFDPNPFLDSLIRTWRHLNYFFIALAGSLFVAAMIINTVYFQELWALRSLRIPSYGPMVVLFIFVSSFGHELLHGLAAKWYGFDVPEVGFHVHYYMPSFYCKILKARDADKKSIGIVLLAGSLFDLAIISVLILIWFFVPAEGVLREMIAFTVSLIWVKILLIQLNPFLPLSDGYRIAGLFIPKRRG